MMMVIIRDLLDLFNLLFRSNNSSNRILGRKCRFDYIIILFTNGIDLHRLIAGLQCYFMYYLFSLIYLLDNRLSNILGLYNIQLWLQCIFIGACMLLHALLLGWIGITEEVLD